MLAAFAFVALLNGLVIDICDNFHDVYTPTGYALPAFGLALLGLAGIGHHRGSH